MNNFIETESNIEFECDFHELHRNFERNVQKLEVCQSKFVQNSSPDFTYKKITLFCLHLRYT